VVLLSTSLQGATIPLVAKRLGVDAPLPLTWETPLEYNPIRGFKSSLREIVIPPHSAAVGKSIMALRLPSTFLVILVGRGERYIIPSGATILQEQDRLLVISEEEPYLQAQALLNGAKAAECR